MIASLKECLTGKHRQSHRHADSRQQQQHTSLASYYLVIKQHKTVPTVQSVHHCHGQNTPKILV